MGKSIFMDCIEGIQFHYEEKRRHVSWGLFMSYDISYGFLKENTRFSELNG